MNAPCHDVEALWCAGATINEIMRLTGLKRSTVEYRLHIKKPSPQRVKRRCMCCGREFMSDGPHNRLCVTCRKKSLTDRELYWDVTWP